VSARKELAKKEAMSELKAQQVAYGGLASQAPAASQSQAFGSLFGQNCISNMTVPVATSYTANTLRTS
jgi:hypothetical protein